MLGLPQSTEIRRALPKSDFFRKCDLKPAQRTAFDADVARMSFVNVLMPQTLPAIAEGNEVKAIFVIEVELKRKDFDRKSIGLIARLIPQRIVFALRFEDNVMLAVYHDKLFTAQWQTVESTSLPLSGLTLDAAWEAIVSTIGQFSIESEKTLSEQIAEDDNRAKLERQIASLEKQMAATKQPRRKREIFEQIKSLKK